MNITAIRSFVVRTLNDNCRIDCFEIRMNNWISGRTTKAKCKMYLSKKQKLYLEYSRLLYRIFSLLFYSGNGRKLFTICCSKFLLKKKKTTTYTLRCICIKEMKRSVTIREKIRLCLRQIAFEKLLRIRARALAEFSQRRMILFDSEPSIGSLYKNQNDVQRWIAWSKLYKGFSNTSSDYPSLDVNPLVLSIECPFIQYISFRTSSYFYYNINFYWKSSSVLLTEQFQNVFIPSKVISFTFCWLCRNDNFSRVLMVLLLRQHDSIKWWNWII